MAQTVKNLPAMQETEFGPWVGKIHRSRRERAGHDWATNTFTTGLSQFQRWPWFWPLHPGPWCKASSCELGITFTFSKEIPSGRWQSLLMCPGILSACSFTVSASAFPSQSRKHASKVRLYYMLHPRDGGCPAKRLRSENVSIWHHAISLDNLFCRQETLQVWEFQLCPA